MQYNPAARFRHTSMEPGQLLRVVYVNCAFALDQSKRTLENITSAEENRVLLALPPLEIKGSIFAYKPICLNQHCSFCPESRVLCYNTKLGT